MKKKQFNEVIYRKLEAQRRSTARKYRRKIRADGFFNTVIVEHMRRGLERHALLMASGLGVFGHRPPPGMDTLFGHQPMTDEQRQDNATKCTIDFVRDPYKFNGRTRGVKLTRAERKQLIEKVMKYANTEHITVTRQQINQIVQRCCPYKPVRSESIDPFVGRLRTERYHAQWVIDLGKLCLTYVQLGSNFPMWTYFRSGRSFTYHGMDYLATTISHNSGFEALARNVKEMAALYKPNLVRGDLDHLSVRTDDIIDEPVDKTRDAFVGDAQNDFRKIVVGELFEVSRTDLKQLQAMSSKHRLPKDEP